MVNPLHTTSHLILTISLRGRYCWPLFALRKRESEISWLKSYTSKDGASFESRPALTSYKPSLYPTAINIVKS